MPELVHLPSSADAGEVCEIVTRDGALILDGVLSPEAVTRALDELTPYVEHTEPGRDDFEGRCTKRTGALVDDGGDHVCQARLAFGVKCRAAEERHFQRDDRVGVILDQPGLDAAGADHALHFHGARLNRRQADG